MTSALAAEVDRRAVVMIPRWSLTGRHGAKVVAFLAITSMSSWSRGQDEPCDPADGLSTCVAADNLWAPLGPSLWLSQGSAQLLPAGGLSVALTSSYLRRPIGLQVASPDPDGTTIYAVDNVLATTLSAAYGLTPILQLGVAAVATPFQDGASKSDIIGSTDTLPTTALGDARLGVKVALLNQTRAGAGAGAGAAGWDLSTRYEMTLPTATEEAFNGSDGPVHAPAASVSYRDGDLSFGGEFGARLRRETKVAGSVIGSQLGLGLAGGYSIISHRDPSLGSWLSVQLETWALFTLAGQQEFVADPTSFNSQLVSSDAHIPAEWALSLRSSALLDGLMNVTLAGGSFIPTAADSAVTTPALRFSLRADYTFDVVKTPAAEP